MKNLKFGAVFLGLAVTVAALVSNVSAQGDTRPSSRDRGSSARAFAFTAGGTQLGVMVSDADSGVRVDEVNANGPADKAGIKTGDLIVEYDGEKVRSARQFTRLVQETPEGRPVSLAVMREGKRQSLTARPDSGLTAWDGVGPEVNRALREAERGMRNFRFELPRERPMAGRSARGRLGVTVQSMTPDLEDFFGAQHGGALVSSVTPGSAAARAGLKAGDVITSVNGHSVHNADELIDEIRGAEGEVAIVVMRGKKETTLKPVLEHTP